jgi:hypothetical protein
LSRRASVLASYRRRNGNAVSFVVPLEAVEALTDAASIHKFILAALGYLDAVSVVVPFVTFDALADVSDEFFVLAALRRRRRLLAVTSKEVNREKEKDQNRNNR